MTKAFDLIGVDGTSSGWVASIGSSKRRCLSSINFFENLDELLTNYPNSVVVIDMPIELNEKNYLRECDILARGIWAGISNHQYYSTVEESSQMQFI